MSTRNLGFSLGQLAKTAYNRRGSDMGGFAQAIHWLAQHVAGNEAITVLERADLVRFGGGYLLEAGNNFALGASHVVAAPAAGTAESFDVVTTVKVPTLGTAHINLVGGGANDLAVQFNYVTDHFELAFGDDLAALHVTGVDLAGVLVADDVVRVTVSVDDREVGTGNITWAVENLSKNLVVSGSVANTDKIVGALAFQYFGQANVTANAVDVVFYDLVLHVAEAEYLKFLFTADYDTTPATGVISSAWGGETATDAGFTDVATNYVARLEV
ncbi:hypothetical protein ACRXCV_00280 (plasmid) [Halobacteriovorax sp. GFR7]|uniref:hypothetical protein n=1 Tax=unclassified Halobacteriovorax TaxID=2639665 RepID=UPI003D9A0673